MKNKYQEFEDEDIEKSNPAKNIQAFEMKK